MQLPRWTPIGNDAYLFEEISSKEVISMLISQFFTPGGRFGFETNSVDKIVSMCIRSIYGGLKKEFTLDSGHITRFGHGEFARPSFLSPVADDPDMDANPSLGEEM